MTSHHGELIRITVDFYREQFSGLSRGGIPEWPPSPFRLAQALMAGCCRPIPIPAARTALESLTRLDNPVIVAPRANKAMLPDTFTHRSGGPMLGSTSRGKVLERLLDTSVADLQSKNKTGKPQSRMILSDTTVVFEVSDPNRSVDEVALNQAAMRVPHLGRSQDACDITISRHDGPLTRSSDQLLLRPRAVSTGLTRGWASNSCEWMDINHAATTAGAQHPPLPAEGYMTRLTYASEHQVDRSQHVILTIELPSLVPPPRISSFLTKLVAALDFQDVRVFPCVTVGSRHANGAMRAIGLQGDDTSVLSEVRDQVRGALGLVPDGSFTASRTASPSYWAQESRDWVAATPCRAFPDERVATHQLVTQATDVTGQRPTVCLSRKPERHWQQGWPHPADGLRHWWPHLHFPEPVHGPLSLGASIAQGFGLFINEGAR